MPPLSVAPEEMEWWVIPQAPYEPPPGLQALADRLRAEGWMVRAPLWRGA